MNQTHTYRRGARVVGGRGVYLRGVAGLGVAIGLAGCATDAPVPSEVPVTSLIASENAPTSYAIDIQNARGSVEVVVDARLIEPRVRAEAQDGSGRPMDASRIAGDEGWVLAAVALDRERATLRVTSGQARAGAERTHLRIDVPSAVGVRVRNSDGPVFLRGVAGEVDVVNGSFGTEGGPVHVTLAAAALQPVSVLTDRGEIIARLGAGTSGQVDAETRKGIVTLEAPGEQVSGAVSSGVRYRATLNGGTNAITLRTGSGDVQVLVGKTP